MIRELARNNRIYESSLKFPIDYEETTKIEKGSFFLNLRVVGDKILFETENYMGAMDFDTKAIMWTKESESYFSIPQSVYGDIAYMIIHGKPGAIDINSGECLWVAKEKEKVVGLSDNSVYCERRDDKQKLLICRNKSDGEIRWCFDQFEGIVSRVVCENNIAVLCSEKSICGFGASEGTLLWSYAVKDFCKIEKECQKISFVIGPLANSIIYFSLTDGSLAAIDASSGRISWSKKQDIATYPQNIIYSGDMIIYNYAQGFLKENYYYFLNAKNGDLIRKTQENITPIGAHVPIITNGYLIGGKKNYISFYDLEKHKFVYRYKDKKGRDAFGIIQPYKNGFIGWNPPKKEIYWYRSQ